MGGGVPGRREGEGGPEAKARAAMRITWYAGCTLGAAGCTAPYAAPISSSMLYCGTTAGLFMAIRAVLAILSRLSSSSCFWILVSYFSESCCDARATRSSRRTNSLFSWICTANDGGRDESASQSHSGHLRVITYR